MVALALTAAFAIVALSAQPATAAPGPLAGTWTSVDLDGSNQTLVLNGAGNPRYSAFLEDDFTSGACIPRPAKLVGYGVVIDDFLFLQGTLVCSPGGNPVPGIRLDFGFEYDAGTDTLTDFSGVVWERAG